MLEATAYAFFPVHFFMMNSHMTSAIDFLGPLMTLLKRGEVAYKNYMTDGKILLHAKILKDNNERIRTLVLEKSHLLPVEYHKYAIDLVAHIDVWYVLWMDLSDRNAYALTDAFVFKNKVRFPAEAVNALCDLYLEIRAKS